MEKVNGGVRINTIDPDGAHWQPTNISMGTTFTRDDLLWYRVKPGDTLDTIAAKFATNVNTLRGNNPATIENTDLIYVGDALMIRKV